MTPRWHERALAEIGKRETGNNAGSNVARYIALSHCGHIGDPWCAIFTNAMLEASGIPGTRSPAARSFAMSRRFKRLADPAIGALTVFWRGAPNGWSGHVGFYMGEADGFVWSLGGNVGDRVANQAFPKKSKTFGLIGYFWPVNELIPPLAPVYISEKTPHKLTSVI